MNALSELGIGEFATLGVVSFAVGVLGGFVGLALGTMRLPALLLFGISAPIAAGTNILVSTVASVGGSLEHFRARRVDWQLVAVMGVPSVIGAFVGGLGSDRVPEGLLVGAVGILVFWQGVEFTFRSQLAQASRRANAHPSTPLRLGTEAGIGLGIGLLGGAVGLILGSVRLPAILRLLAIEPRTAVGTNLFIGILLGLAGFTGHGIAGEVDLPLVSVMGGTALVGSLLGARLTGRVQLNTLIRVIGLVLTAVGVLLVVSAIW